MADRRAFLKSLGAALVVTQVPLPKVGTNASSEAVFNFDYDTSVQAIEPPHTVSFTVNGLVPKDRVAVLLTDDDGEIAEEVYNEVVHGDAVRVEYPNELAEEVEQHVMVRVRHTEGLYLPEEHRITTNGFGDPVVGTVRVRDEIL